MSALSAEATLAENVLAAGHFVWIDSGCAAFVHQCENWQGHEGILLSTDENSWDGDGTEECPYCGMKLKFVQINAVYEIRESVE
jgi:hypothetical protein